MIQIKIDLSSCDKCGGARATNEDEEIYCINCGKIFWKNVAPPIPTIPHCDGSGLSAIPESVVRSKNYKGRCSVCAKVVQLDHYGLNTINHPETFRQDIGMTVKDKVREMFG